MVLRIGFSWSLTEPGFVLQVDLFAKDRIIIPINLGNSHWVCSAINIREKRFEYYDSLGHQNSGVYKVGLFFHLQLLFSLQVGRF